MKRANDHVNNQSDGGNSDLNKKAKVSGKRGMMNDPYYGGMYMGGVDANGMMMMNPSIGVSGGAGGPMMVPGAMAESNRTIYLGGITKDICAREIFDVVKTGNVEFLRLLPEKGCAFLCFVDPVGAELFFQNAKLRPLQIHGMEIKVGWAKSSPINPSMQQAIQQGVSRNVFINRLDAGMDTAYLTSALSQFGEIEMIKILQEKNIAFVYFSNIPSALNCVNALSKDPLWQGRRISYGRDRCNPQQQHQHIQHQPAGGQLQQFGVGNYGGQNQLGSMGGGMGYAPNVDRTIYIGNLKPTDTCEDICTAVRGGQIYQIRQIKEKCTAFVTFVDPYSATTVYNHGNTVGLAVNGRRVKVGWGKASSIPFATMAAIFNGATRNIYLGSVEQPIPVEQLQRDFSKYGELEMIKYIPDKKCCFINFTNVNSAMRARREIPMHPSYSHFNVNYGKDRCAKPFTIPDPKRQKSQQQQQQNDEQPIQEDQQQQNDEQSSQEDQQQQQQNEEQTNQEDQQQQQQEEEDEGKVEEEEQNTLHDDFEIPLD